MNRCMEVMLTCVAKRDRHGAQFSGQIIGKEEGATHEFLFRMRKWSGMHFVVEVEGALKFLCGGKLFSISRLVCGKTEYCDARVTRGRARNKGVDKVF